MVTLGEVSSILSENYILVRSDQDLELQKDLVVVGEVELEAEQKKKLGLDKVIYPKGRITIIARQESPNTFLASLTVKKSEKKVIYKNPFSKLAGILGEYEEVVREVPVSPKPKIDKDQSLNLTFDEKITVGDKVCPSDYFKG